MPVSPPSSSSGTSSSSISIIAGFFLLCKDCIVKQNTIIAAREVNGLFLLI